VLLREQKLLRAVFEKISTATRQVHALVEEIERIGLEPSTPGATPPSRRTTCI